LDTQVIQDRQDPDEGHEERQQDQGPQITRDHHQDHQEEDKQEDNYWVDESETFETSETSDEDDYRDKESDFAVRLRPGHFR
jgi:hypothetical protein